MGMGKGSSSSAPVVTEEQKELLRKQTDFLTKTAFPAYEKTISGAKEAYDISSPYVADSASDAYRQAGSIGAAQEAAGYMGLSTGMAGLASLFDPEYEKGQVNAALQAGREATREQLAGQNAMYGASGGLGSSRQALADKNLQQLGEQRQATAAAQAQAGVQANKAAAAQALMGQGASLLPQAMQTKTGRIAIAETPQDMWAKYASVVYGTPQQSTTPNFSGTQGANTTGKGFGVNATSANSIYQGSDISIKENIEKIGVLENGLSLYKFEYKDQYKDTWGHGTQIGVMAQDVEKLMPEAVAIHADGYKMVNYAMVM